MLWPFLCDGVYCRNYFRYTMTCKEMLMAQCHEVCYFCIF